MISLRLGALDKSVHHFIFPICRLHTHVHTSTIQVVDKLKRAPSMRKFNLLGEETAKIQAGPRRGTLWARAMGGMGLNGGEVSSQVRPSMVVGMRRRGREEVATQTDMSSLGGGKFQARQRTMSVRALDGVLGEEAEDPFDPDEIMDYGAFKNPLKNIGKGKKEGKLPKEKVLLLLSDIYAAKCIEDATAERGGKPYAALPDFLEDFFLRKVGLRKPARKKLGELISSVRKLKDSDERIRVFATLCGLHDETMYTPDTIQMYCLILRRLYPNHKQIAECWNSGYGNVNMRPETVMKAFIGENATVSDIRTWDSPYFVSISSKVSEIMGTPLPSLPPFLRSYLLFLFPLYSFASLVS